ncbi:MAG: glutathione S-transferase family protein [Neomegalonema sp.]|nr:glutathione S-transferase family protein [Neomegalonema sp.]
MGMLIDGAWIHDDGAQTVGDGSFQRKPSTIRNWITPDGAAGPTGEGGFKAEPGRYHLYVAWACPWAHRTLIFRALKGLEDMIDVSVVHWFKGDEGWTFEDGPDVTPDPVFNARTIYEIYAKAQSDFTGRCSVPLLLDKKTGRMVSNESSEIIRMFGAAFDEVGAAPGDYYPRALRAEIDAVNERIYDTLNNGVYRCGFAKSQSAYDAASAALFETLDWLEARLGAQRYLVGDQITEADWRLFVTLYRFDAVYNSHFKCTQKRIVDYPALWAYTRELYQVPGVRETTHLADTRRHYFGSHHTVNPYGVLPLLPAGLDFDAPHGRESAFGTAS